MSSFDQKVDKGDLLADSFGLLIDNVSDAPLADSKLPEPFCSSNPPDFFELDNRSFECNPK
ncbi:hypothetical protein KIN20_005308 [Parelaphostrongylus tenuis]|uniref:Uncharacterized protein n=1 Tax=Parelaphostrongylus tenuis TaxID=148309 RepID=A0AAD5QFT2_PARTN|nr:hypothetical protein KIN20_005308 [Parelaphostrongylus tenuis]